MTPTNDAVTASGKTTVYGLFSAQVKRNRDTVAMEYQGRSWTYGALDDRVRRLARVLADHRIVRGDRVAILSENRPEYIEAELACAMTGAILACQNWRLMPDELRHCVELVAPKLVLVSARNLDNLAAIKLVDTPVIDFDEGYSDLLHQAEPAQIRNDVDPEDGLIILYTSGTTGLPKGALISHRAMIARMCLLRLDVGISSQHGFIAWAPMFHMVSTDQQLNALMSGSTVIVIDGFEPAEIVEAAVRHPIGWFVMMPGVIEPMIDYLERCDPKPKLKSIACVGAMADLVPRQQIADLTRLLNAPYLNSFGATETGAAPASANLIPIGQVDYSLSKRISAMCEVQLVDDAGIEVADGDPGELAIRGPSVFSGYWNAEETNAQDFAGGWFRMGDLFVRNEDGSIDFVDRAKYMIKSGGENIYPAEIERVLLADKRIADAVVVRKPDDKWGEVPVAFVVALDETLTADDVEALCREKLAGYKRPKEVRFIGLEELPRSTTGKIQRHEMEAWLLKYT